MTTPTPKLVELAERISPDIRKRIEAGQQFNAYERADGNGWLLCLGPITNAVRLGEFPTQEAAEFFTEALRPTIRDAFRRVSQELPPPPDAVNLAIRKQCRFCKQHRDDVAISPLDRFGSGPRASQENSRG